ncbi:uncharacterized protein LOC129595499 [Paramacrobiotus metropolitanus]|uniref:uncharacterized protein LOC129595499 n=1 Tax=Paramacrobiotus metropolitanus TaxID=2943436 RepID=UPI002445E82B|nr:uncharacterized protein LOC129595499 [Paramacrobiotus metropolitanus]
MSVVGEMSFVRSTDDFVPCERSPVVEVGWFGLRNQHEDPDCKEYVDDRDRQLLRTLAVQWSVLCAMDPDTRLQQYKQEGSHFPTGTWRPLIHLRTWMEHNRAAFDRFSPHIVCSGRAVGLLLDQPNTTHKKTGHQFVACRRQNIVYFACAQQNAASKPTAVNGAKPSGVQQLDLVTTESSEVNAQNISIDYFYSVLGWTIGSTRLLYSHKIDCIEPSMGAAPGSYTYLGVVEDHRARGPDKPRCPLKYQTLDRAIWNRCTVSGSKRVVLGITQNNELIRCDMIQPAGIPDKTQCPLATCNHWSKRRSISYLNQVLEFIRAVVQKDYKCAAYGFTVDCRIRDHVSVQAVEWTAGTEDFEANNILRVWEEDAPAPAALQPR